MGGTPAGPAAAHRAVVLRPGSPFDNVALTKSVCNSSCTAAYLKFLTDWASPFHRLAALRPHQLVTDLFGGHKLTSTEQVRNSLGASQHAAGP